MQELSLLNKKCLTNMPMMLDIIAITTNNLKKALIPFMIILNLYSKIIRI